MKSSFLSAQLDRIEQRTQNKYLLGWGLLGFLSLIWGSSFILMKRGLEAFDPFQVGAFRILIAGLALLPFLIIRKVPFKEISRETWWGLAAVGFFGNGIPAFLFPLAETGLNSATTGILNALTPMFTLVIGALFFSLAFTKRKVFGLILGLVGSVLLVALGGGKEGVEVGFLVERFSYASYVLMATICYGVTGNVLKRVVTNSSLDALTVTGLALCIASIPYWGYFFLTASYKSFAQEGAWTAFGYLAILGLLGTAFATVIFNYLIKITDAVFASSVTYLVPIVALGWGILDGESMHFLQGFGMLFILLGVYQVTRT